MQLKISKTLEGIIARAAFNTTKAGMTHSLKDILTLELLREEGSLAYQLLSSRLKDWELYQIRLRIERDILAADGQGPAPDAFYRAFTDELRSSVEGTTRSISTAHALLAIVRDRTTATARVLEMYGITADSLSGELRRLATEEEFRPVLRIGMAGPGNDREAGAAPAEQLLDRFGTDLTQLAREGRIDPVVGRDAEIERVVQILSRRRKNNPILIGEAGVGKSAVVAIAAALTLTVAVASGIVTLIKADVSPADKVDDATHRAFTDDIDAAAPVVDDGKGGLVPVPDMERIPGDVQTTQRLVGQYLSKLDAEMTVDSNTIKLGTFLIDENGLGLLTYSVENPSGVGYTDVGYGEGIDLPLQPTLHFRSPDEGNALFAKCYVDKETSTDTCLNVVLYFAAGTSFRQGDLLYVTMQDELGQPYSIAVQPRTYVPVATLTSGSETLTLSPLGMSIRNAHPDREPLVDELTLRYQDGSEFTVESSSRSLMNWVVGCMRGSDDVPFADNTYVFDRLVDVDAVSSVTLEGHQHTDGAADDTFTLTYQP